MNNDPAPASLLSDLKSSDPDRVRSAVEELTDVLTAHARMLLGPRKKHANCQAESVVQSVLVRELGGGAHAFQNEAHLNGRLRLAVENKIKDRRKGPKGATGQASQFPDGALRDRAAADPGIGTQVVETDRRHEIEARLTANLTREDQELVQLCILGEIDSNEAARTLSLTADAVRKRLQRLRPELRARLLAPFKERVSAQDWALITACLIQRLAPAQVTEMFGRAPGALADTLERIFREILNPALGDAGMLALTRLLGKPSA
jgi:DNA-directed RNA polymerase specialized sigma24 family protein